MSVPANEPNLLYQREIGEHGNSEKVLYGNGVSSVLADLAFSGYISAK